MAILAYDAFYRPADSPTSLGPAWTNQTGSGSWNIVSASVHQVQPSNVASDCVGVFTAGAAWDNDQYSKFTIVTVTGSGVRSGGGPAVRLATGAVTGYFLYVNDAAGSDTYLVKRVADVTTTLGTTDNGWLTGDVIGLEVVGSSLIAKKNDTQVDSTSDSAIASGNPGIGYSSTITAFVGDPWEAGNFTTLPAGLTHVPIVKDSFNRPNSTGLGGAGTGWSTVTGLTEPNVASNQGSSSADPMGARFSGATWPNDQYAQIQLTGTLTTNDTDGAGVTVRGSTGGAETHYKLRWGAHVTAGAAQNAGILEKRVAGVKTEYTYFSPATSGDIIYLDILGSTLTVKLNGTILFRMTDTSLTSGQAGLAGSGAPDTVTWDNFEGGMLLAGESLGYIQQNKLRPRIFGPGIAR